MLEKIKSRFIQKKNCTFVSSSKHKRTAIALICLGMLLGMSQVAAPSIIFADSGRAQQLDPNQESVKAARKKLDEMDIDFSRKTFLDAVTNGEIAVVEVLLDAGMDPNVSLERNKFSLSALTIAADKGDLNIMKLLLDRGAEVNPKSPVTPLSIAIEEGQTVAAKLLLDRGANANANVLLCSLCSIRYGNDYMATPLIIAVAKGNAEIAKALLEKGADINAKVTTDSVNDGLNGKTALEIAVDSSNAEILKILLERGAKIGQELIDSVVRQGNTGLKFLKDAGVPIKPEYIGIVNRVKNEKSTIESLHLINFKEGKYQSEIGNGDFGSATDLFMNDFIDEALANAAGVPTMTSSGGRQCKGNGEPEAGYKFRITYSPATPKSRSKFTALAIAAIQSGENRTGDRNFFIDETDVIRASTNTRDIPDVNSAPINRY